MYQKKHFGVAAGAAMMAWRRSSVSSRVATKNRGPPRISTTSISVSDDGQTLYLTTRAAFNVGSASGGHSMVYAYDFASEAFSGPLFVAADNGLSRHVDGLHVEGLLP